MFKTTLTAILLASTAAFGAQITAGPSVQDVTFVGSATGLTVTAPPQLDMLAFDTTNPGLGGAWILDLDFTTGPEVGGFFTANPNSATFKYTAADGDALFETIHVTRIQDGTDQPKVYFVGDPPSSITGDPEFVAALSGANDGDWVMNRGVNLSGLVGSASATISALEITPSTVPEPAVLGTFGGALLLLGWLRRRA